jgi:polyphenol oxidase
MKLCDFYYQEISPGVQQVKGFFPEEFVGLQTTRAGGVSTAPFDSFNLATHVGDEPEAVSQNRERLAGFLPSEPVWLEQVHGCEATVISRNAEGVTRQSAADASITAEPNQPCAIMTADCLPLLVARPSTGHCAAIHAGWKGLAAGVIETTLQRMLAQQIAGGSLGQPSPILACSLTPDTWYIWLGPAIRQAAFEVGPEVREKFVQHHPVAGAAFLPSPKREGHFMASLEQLTLLRLNTFKSLNPGLELRVAIDRSCVFACPESYFSFRRNPQTGRMASLIFRRMPESP